MATQVRTQKRPRKRASLTPINVLQMFSGALIASVLLISMIIFAMRLQFDFEPAGEFGFFSMSPVYAVFIVSVCLVMSFLLPEFILDSARRSLKKETAAHQTEDIPFILIPSIFVRYSLLAMVALVSFMMSFGGQAIGVFLPVAVVSILLMFAYFPTDARMKSWLKH